MAVTISGTDGISTPPVVVQGSTSGGITLAAPAVAGTNTQTLVAATGTLAPIVSGTAVASTSGTSIDFTGIPSWAKRITVMFSGVSTSGASPRLIQIGSTTFTTTGYVTSSAYFNTGSALGCAQFTTGFGVNSVQAVDVIYGAFILSLQNPNTNLWVLNGSASGTSAGVALIVSGGTAPALAGTLDRVRITTVNGTDTFDAGSINIMYE